MRFRLLVVAVPFLALGCLEARPGQQFEKALLDIARTYETFHQVEAHPRWAPVLCADPGALPEDRNTVQAGDYALSTSDDSLTHGRKLYVLFAKQLRPDSDPLDGTDYVEAGKANPVGQVIVKEAWIPEEVKDDGKPLPSIDRHGRKVVPYARRNGKLYHAAEKASLFIMFKMDPGTPDTDEGWVYGTVTADGKTATSAGRVESCMKCHRRAAHDRLFGLAPER